VIRRSFTGDAPTLGPLNLELGSITAAVTAIPSGHLQWSTAAELSHRTFRNVIESSALNPELTSHGYEFKYRAVIEDKVFAVPERRFSVTAEASSETARLWSSSAHFFEKLEGSALARWFPLAQADTDEQCILWNACAMIRSFALRSSPVRCKKAPPLPG
jgi:hypothetical protein